MFFNLPTTISTIDNAQIIEKDYFPYEDLPYITKSWLYLFFMLKNLSRFISDKEKLQL